MKILIINLARAMDRKRFMQQQLDALGLDYEFIDGTDYRNMSEADFRANCHERALTGSNYLKGVFAASLSHLKAYKKIVAENLDYALVCEDDAVFPANIKQLLEELAVELKPTEIILLSYYSHLQKPLVLSNRNATELKHGLALLLPVDIDPVASAMAYIVPKQVAADLVRVLMPVNHVPDRWGTFYNKGGFKQLRCLYPHVMSDAPFTAIVEYPATQTWLFKLKSLLRKIPIASAFIKVAMQKRAIEKYKFIVSDGKPFIETMPAANL